MMQKKDFGNDAPLLGAIAQVATADVTGAACDCLEHDSVYIEFNIGNSGDTLSGSVYAELEIQTSDDNSTWVAAADADLSATAVTGTNTGTIAVINAPAEDSLLIGTAYLGRERYVRGVVNLTGTHSNGIPVAIQYRRSRDKYT